MCSDFNCTLLSKEFNMNNSFKVVFNKARGALMVVNEITSTVQAKGTKTVVATAVAAMIAGVAGSAMAATDNTILIENQKYENPVSRTKRNTRDYTGLRLCDRLFLS